MLSVMSLIMKIWNFGLNKKKLDPISDKKMFTKWPNVSLFTIALREKEFLNYFLAKKLEAWHTGHSQPRARCHVAAVVYFWEISWKFPRNFPENPYFEKKNQNSYFYFPLWNDTYIDIFQKKKHLFNLSL